jgi:hypothetical protein
MIGVPLTELDKKLPLLNLNKKENRFDRYEREMKERGVDEDYFNRLTAEEAIEKYSFVDLCELYSIYPYMSEFSREIFQNFDSEYDVHYNVIWKVVNCLWRVGCNDDWDESVEAFNQIGSFSMDVKDFDCSLTWTTGTNPKGRNHHDYKNGLFIDGVFAYLVHYKGKHVMTVGFNVMPDMQIAITQIQNVNKKGNRFRYKLPDNLLEFFIDRFSEAFPKHQICMVDGGDLGREILADYETSLEGAETVYCLARERKTYSYETSEEHNETILQYKNDFAMAKQKLCSLKEEALPRIEKFYGMSLGKYKRLRAVKRNGRRYHPVKKKGPVNV